MLQTCSLNSSWLIASDKLCQKYKFTCMKKRWQLLDKKRWQLYRKKHLTLKFIQTYKHIILQMNLLSRRKKKKTKSNQKTFPTYLPPLKIQFKKTGKFAVVVKCLWSNKHKLCFRNKIIIWLDLPWNISTSDMHQRAVNKFTILVLYLHILIHFKIMTI